MQEEKQSEDQAQPELDIPLITLDEALSKLIPFFQLGNPDNTSVIVTIEINIKERLWRILNAYIPEQPTTPFSDDEAEKPEVAISKLALREFNPAKKYTG